LGPADARDLLIANGIATFLVSYYAFDLLFSITKRSATATRLLSIDACWCG